MSTFTTPAERERLHAFAVDRRYDLRTCNPTHRPFYAFMERYKDAVDSAPMLLILAAEIEAYQANVRTTPEMWAAYGQLAELARWRVTQLDVLIRRTQLLEEPGLQHRTALEALQLLDQPCDSAKRAWHYAMQPLRVDSCIVIDQRDNAIQELIRERAVDHPTLCIQCLHTIDFIGTEAKFLVQ